MYCIDMHSIIKKCDSLQPSPRNPAIHSFWMSPQHRYVVSICMVLPLTPKIPAVFCGTSSSSCLPTTKTGMPKMMWRNKCTSIEVIGENHVSSYRTCSIYSLYIYTVVATYTYKYTHLFCIYIYIYTNILCVYIPWIDWPTFCQLCQVDMTCHHLIPTNHDRAWIGKWSHHPATSREPIRCEYGQGSNYHH